MKQLKFTLCALLVTACSHADPNKALQEAKDFVKNIDNATNVTCNDSDSDGDGYVSCTVFRKGADPLAISCGAENWCMTNCAKGCKITPIKPASSSND
jgi:hypothetical protein